MKKIKIAKVLAIFLALIIFCGQISIATDEIIQTTKDGSYVINYTEDLFELKDKLSQGEVNVLKSVKYNNDKTFDISLKSQGLGFSKTKINQKEYNLVFVLDNSGSMYGDSGRVQACVSAINSIIKDLSSSENIKLSVVAYSSGSHLDYASDGEKGNYINSNKVSADTLLDLKHYDSSAYIGYEDNYGTDTSKDYNSRNTLRWMYSSTGKKFYAGNTNTQAGIIKAYEILKNASNKDTATPVIILMSDGEATNYAYSGDYLKGFKYDFSSVSQLDKVKSAFSNEYTQNQLAGYCAILSANMARNELNNLYKNKCKFYTLGYSLEQNYDYCLGTLNPNSTNLKKAGNMMKSGYSNYGLNYLVNSSDYSQDLKAKYEVSTLKYNDKYYEGNTKNIKEIYKSIVTDSVTEYEDYGPIKNGTYLTIEDTLGEKFNINTDKNNIEMKLKISNLDNKNNKDEKISLTKENENTYRYKDANREIIYDLKNKKVTLKLLASYVNGNKIDLTFVAELEEDASGTAEGITYYTNDTKNTSCNFTPESGNPFYGSEKQETKIETTGSITLKKDKEPEKIEITETNIIKENITEKNTIIGNTTINEVTENKFNKTEENVVINNKTESNETINNKIQNNETINNKTINNIKETNKEEVKEKQTETTKVTKLPKTGRDIDISKNIKNFIK